MLVTHRIELAPVVDRVDCIRRACGTDRFTWSQALVEWIRQYASGARPSVLKLRKQFSAGKYAGFPWLEEAHRDAYAAAFTRPGRAWNRFFTD